MHPLDTLAEVCLADHRRVAARDLNAAVRRHAVPHHEGMLDRVRAALPLSGHEAGGHHHGSGVVHHG